MESALIVSCKDQGTKFFAEQLEIASSSSSLNEKVKISVLNSCIEARKNLLEHDYDIVIINAPLNDETGESLAKNIAAKGTSQVILVVKNEFFDTVSSLCENDGILTVSKPINRTIFWSVLTLAKSASKRIRRIRNENARLKQKIEDIRIVDRAKWLLVSHMNMSEQEAHRHIEKQAMDLRTTKRQIAEEILKTYES